MTSIQKSYADAVHGHFPKYFANFPPNSPVALGDYGILKDGIFNRLGSGESLGVRPKAVAAGGVGTFQFTTGDDVAITLGVAANADVPGIEAQAGGSIKFGRTGAVFFAAAGCQVFEFDDEKPARDRVLEAFFVDDWQPEWVLVTRTVVAKVLNLLVSQSAGAYADLQGSGSTSIDFTDVRSAAKLTVKSSNAIGHQFVGEQETVPLLSLLRVRRRLFGGTTITHLAGQPPLERLKADRDRMAKAGVVLKDRFETIDVAVSGEFS